MADVQERLDSIEKNLQLLSCKETKNSSTESGTVQMLNKMSTAPKIDCFTEDGWVLKQPEGNSKMFWLSVSEPVNMHELKIQIETAAAGTFQNETSGSNELPGNVNAIFTKIVRDLINRNSESQAENLSQPENNNANPAKADIKG